MPLTQVCSRRLWKAELAGIAIGGSSVVGDVCVPSGEKRKLLVEFSKHHCRRGAFVYLSWRFEFVGVSV